MMIDEGSHAFRRCLLPAVLLALCTIDLQPAGSGFDPAYSTQTPGEAHMTGENTQRSCLAGWLAGEAASQAEEGSAATARHSSI
jgi:hypothetical protein